MDKKKKGLMLSILGIISIVLITVGLSLAFFNYAREGTTDNVITTDTITFLYTEVSGVGNGISIENAFPKSDEKGKVATGEGEYFDFKITSKTANMYAIPYEVTARKSSDSDEIDENIRVYLTKGETNEELLLDNYSNLIQTQKVSEDKYTEKTIYTGEVPEGIANYEESFRLRMWLDEDARFDTNDLNNKKFTLTVNVYANARVVTNEEIAYENNTNISLLSIDNQKLTIKENLDYDYQITLPTGTTSTEINIETENPNAEVTVEKLDSLASTSNVKRLSITKKLELTDSDNYFKITVTSENKKEIKEYKIKIGIVYEETLLNGTDPVLTDNLVPIEIDNNGKVTKASLSEEWYDYETKKWANAVVLKDDYTIYEDGQIIEEEAIESYFVWIPKYSYKLWDLGKYEGFTTAESKEHPIGIKFGLTNTSDTVTGECTTPGVAGESGNCDVGEYMTHPAFLAFDTNGLWVGKFETGYDGATTTEEAQIDSSDSSKIVIKPNTYSWRDVTLSNAFKAGLEYLSNEESHIIKNTEWGSVAYLQHSEYGSATSVRINNNSAHITGYAAINEPTSSTTANYEETKLGVDGTYTVNYLNKASTVASTTGNYSGIYDMSGGTKEVALGYSSNATYDESNITNLYPNFFTDEKYKKYYDTYESTHYNNFNNRILGDATGEMGPMSVITDETGTKIGYDSSWHDDVIIFIQPNRPWFYRGNNYSVEYFAGIFSSFYYTGANSAITFRIVLAPTK